MSDILVDPTDGCRGLVVVADVTHELACKVFDRSEDTSGNHVTLNLGKPNFDLVKPTGVGRGVVNPNCAVSLQKFKDFLRLVRAQIVGDDMDLTTCRLALYDLRKEIDELGAGVACAGFRQDLSGLSVQSAVERKSSMAVVLEAMPFSAAGRKWQNRIQAIQRLDGALLVHGEDSGMHWRVEVQPDDVGGLFFKFRIITGHVATRTVRLQSKFAATLD
jgi:hypothetical protein